MIENILKQAPEGTSNEIVEELLKKYDGNVVNILTELWKIDKPIKNVPYKKEKNKWENIREICEAYEQEMSKFINGNK